MLCVGNLFQEYRQKYEELLKYVVEDETKQVHERYNYIIFPIIVIIIIQPIELHLLTFYSNSKIAELAHPASYIGGNYFV